MKFCITINYRVNVVVRYWPFTFGGWNSGHAVFKSVRILFLRLNGEIS